MRRDRVEPETLRLSELALESETSGEASVGADAETRDPSELVAVTETPIEREVAARRARPWAARLLLAAIGLFAAAAIGAAAEAVVLSLLSDGIWVHAPLLAGALALVGALVIVAVRELRGIMRLARLRRHKVRAAAVQSHATGADPALLRDLEALYGHRPELEWALSAYRQEGGGNAGRERLDAFERHVVASLDEAAQSAIVRGVRRAGGGAAISPFALLDIAITAIVDFRLVGEIARLYGGRPGALATLRLLRIAFVDVVAAGALELSQDTISNAIGADITSRVSGRAGAALVNALLTAKLGRAAMDACRPVPWSARTPPGPRACVVRAIGRRDHGR